ncbi:MAG: putative quinol monooxygenase [Dehalococcoidia bacterium]
MITLVAKLTAAEGKADELKAVLSQMVADVAAAEKGPVACYSLHTSDTDPNVFLFYEQYASKEAVDAHGKTPHMAAMGGKLAAGKLLAGRPVIERFTQIAGI